MRPTRRAAISGILAALLASRQTAEATDGRELTRVFIHYSRSARDGRRIAAEVALYLESRGYEIAEIRSVGFAVDNPRVRYFYVADRSQAERVSAHLDRYLARATNADKRTVVQDYTRYAPPPRRGTIEVWIATETAFRTADRVRRSRTSGEPASSRRINHPSTPVKPFSADCSGHACPAKSASPL